MVVYFKNLNEKQLKEIFESNREIQKDIKGMMELAECESKNQLGYFISECKNGVYSESYYNEQGVITQ